jgi:hypothetical protein
MNSDAEAALSLLARGRAATTRRLNSLRNSLSNCLLAVHMALWPLFHGASYHMARVVSQFAARNDAAEAYESAKGCGVSPS